jgi:hypothetical protein
VDERDLEPPICERCGVTMVPAELSRLGAEGREWICAECEDADEPGAE